MESGAFDPQFQRFPMYPANYLQGLKRNLHKRPQQISGCQCPARTAEARCQKGTFRITDQNAQG